MIDAVLSDYDLTHLNTLGLASKAACFVRLTDPAQLPPLLIWAQGANLPVLILGEGSNVVLPEHYAGLVIQNAISGRRIDPAMGRVVAGAGESWHGLVDWCCERGWNGLEPLALIPGTVGASPVQNIGAYGAQLSDFEPWVRAFDRHDERWVELTPEQAAYAYRESLFKRELGRYVIVEVSLKLTTGAQLFARYPDLQARLGGEGPHEPRALFNAVVAIRQAKLHAPEELGNAGSFFKNPAVTQAFAEALKTRWPDLPTFDYLNAKKLSAGWLIDQAGWKGFRRGDAGVSPKHALVLVNYGQATATQIKTLAEEIAASVEQKFGVRLEPEPRFI